MCHLSTYVHIQNCQIIKIIITPRKDSSLHRAGLTPWHKSFLEWPVCVHLVKRSCLCASHTKARLTDLRCRTKLLNMQWSPLWPSSQSSWLLIQRFGFDSLPYQIFWDAVGLERGPLSLVSTTEEHTRTAIRGRIFVRARIRAGSRFRVQADPVFRFDWCKMFPRTL
jgi:hypothetical protein